MKFQKIVLEYMDISNKIFSNNNFLKLISILILLNIKCFSQEKIKFITFENNEYSIQYPSNLTLKESELGSIIQSPFSIADFSDNTSNNFPVVSLEIYDYSRLGMGKFGIQEILLKNNIVNIKFSNLNNMDYYETISEKNGFIIFKYIFNKNEKFYCLTTLSSINDFCLKKDEILMILNTFLLK